MRLFKLISKFISLCITLCILTVFAGVGYAIFYEPNTLKEREINLTSNETFSSFSIAQFSDTHFGFGYTLEDFEKVIESINSKNVDYVFFTGDLFDNFENFEGDVSEISYALSRINATKGKYAVYGNHDYGGGAENYYVDIMKNGGFTVLKNTAVYFPEDNLRIAGVDDFLIGYGDINVISNLYGDCYDLVLCHEPDVFDQFDKTILNLMLSGHSHGGQINIPFIKHKFLTNLGSIYTKGLYTQENSNIYVTSGLGTTKIDARLLAPPEVAFININ